MARLLGVMETTNESSFLSANDAASGKVFLIGISGGSASGKTSVANRVIQNINLPNVILISMDSFYRVLSPAESQRARRGEYNFDTPEAFDLPLLEECLLKLKHSVPVDIPEYDFCTHSRTQNSTRITDSSVVVFEGIMTLCPVSILPLLDLKVFVDTDDDVRLARRLIRDIAQRGRTQDSVFDMHFKFAKAGYDNYIAPSARNADLIIPRGGDNEVAINLLIKHIKHQLKQKGMTLHDAMSNLCGEHKYADANGNLSSGVVVLEPTTYVRGLLAVAKNAESPKRHLTEAYNMLAGMLIERALAVGTCNSMEPNSPTELNSRIRGISFARLGCMLEEAVQKHASSIPVSKLDIQKNAVTGRFELHPTALPPNLSGCPVLVMDSSIFSGSTAVAAVKALMQHNLNPENTIFVCFFCSIPGLASVQQAFPEMRIVCAEIAENFPVIPNFNNIFKENFDMEAE